MTHCTIIFDLDGTLVDTLQDLADAANRTLQACSLDPLPVQDYRYLVGAGARNLILRCLEASGQDMDPDDAGIEAIITLFKSFYQQNWLVRSCPYPGVNRMLKRLAAAGCRMAVLSNKPDDFTRQMVAHYFPDQPFAAVLGQKKGLPLKPDPTGALGLCRKMGCDPAQAVLIGDTGSDMETAVRAGMLPLGVLWGFRDTDELLAGGAEHLFSSTDELVTWLLAWANDHPV